MSKEKTEAPKSWDEIAAQMPTHLRNSPLTVGGFYNLLAPIVESHKQLKQRVAQLEKQASGNGGDHG
ncbi:hypothetical protein ACPPVV_09465 [Rhodanobacter sp. Col0626]|uniref:hypothetical protein n=1 Tax=Rhodanobacter sp. Col0626 TaxID=3415679 RepID=UPI003CF086C0